MITFAGRFNEKRRLMDGKRFFGIIERRASRLVFGTGVIATSAARWHVGWPDWRLPSESARHIAGAAPHEPVALVAYRAGFGFA